MSPNPILAELRAGKTVVGMWIHTGSPVLAEAAVHRGWNVLFVDNEHGFGSLDRAVAIHRAALAAGGEVVLRVPSSDPAHLKLVVDRGFRCIMEPKINTAEEARMVADACLYPPHGKRGYAAPIVRGSDYGQNKDYDDWTKDWTTRVGLKPEEMEALIPLMARGALPPKNARPRNFSEGVFRGGESAEDLYRRIYHGIAGSPMPASTFVPGQYEETDIWHLINFIRSLEKSEPQVTEAI